MKKTCILASKNESVDAWNALVQLLNPVEEIHELASHDYRCDVDDQYIGHVFRFLDSVLI